MQFRKLRACSLKGALRWPFLVATVVFVLAAGAEEEGGAKAAVAPEPKDQHEFTQKTSRMNSLATRIEEDEKQFQELVRAKAETKSPEEKQRFIKQMVSVTEDRNKSADEYNKLKGELGLRYPNQGEHSERGYRTQSKKSVEEMEGAAGLDELLTRTKKIIEKKFAPFNKEDTKEVKKATTETTDDGDKPKVLRLEK